MNSARSIVLFLLLIALAAGSAFAAQGGNPKKGKYLFKKNCKECHVAGAEGGEVTPLSKTQAQWDRFFDRDRHEDNPAGFEGLSDQDLKDVQQFLFDHAADSPQPQTCG